MKFTDSINNAGKLLRNIQFLVIFFVSTVPLLLEHYFGLLSTTICAPAWVFVAAYPVVAIIFYTVERLQRKRSEKRLFKTGDTVHVKDTVWTSFTVAGYSFLKPRTVKCKRVKVNGATTEYWSEDCLEKRGTN